MKKEQVKVGAIYFVKVSGFVQPVRIDKDRGSITRYVGGRPRDIHAGWDGTNLKTKRPVRIHSAQKLRLEVERTPDGQAWQAVKSDATLHTRGLERLASDLGAKMVEDPSEPRGLSGDEVAELRQSGPVDEEHDTEGFDRAWGGKKSRDDREGERRAEQRFEDTYGGFTA